MPDRHNVLKPHCEKHCKVDFDGNDQGRPEHDHKKHDLDDWEDCWDCYLETK